MTMSRFITTLALLAVATTTLAAPVDIPNQFTAGTTAVADDVNANFTAIETAVDDNDARITTNTQRITDGNRIPNGDFSNGLAGWSMELGSLELATGQDGPAGDAVAQNPANTLVRGGSDTWIPINRNRTYRVMGSFRLLSGGSAGTLYLAVRLRDAAGAEITGDGSYWYYPAGGVVPPDNQWATYSAEFGAGTAREFPPEARYATVGFFLNYDGGVEGNRIFQVQGLGIFEATPRSAWTDLSLTGGATAYGGSYQVPQYRKVGDEVCLRGLVGSVTACPSCTMATLPSGYRPPARLLFQTGADRVDIFNNGSVVAYSDGDASNWTSLDGICFSTTP